MRPRVRLPLRPCVHLRVRPLVRPRVRLPLRRCVHLRVRPHVPLRGLSASRGPRAPTYLDPIRSVRGWVLRAPVNLPREPGQKYLEGEEEARAS